MSTSNRFFVVVAVVVGAASSGCGPAPDASLFGALCSTNETCAPLATENSAAVDLDKLHCLPSPVDGRGRCLPPRATGSAGESCAQPLTATQPSTTTGLLVDQSLFFGGAVDNEDVECGGRVGAADVVVRFVIDDVVVADPADQSQSVSVPQPGIRLHIEGPSASGYGMAIRPAIEGDVCGPVQRYGCGENDNDIVLANIAPGAWDVVVDGAAFGVGGFEQPAHLIVERLDCPPFALPFDEQRCVRTSTVMPMLTPRIGHTLHVTADGSIVAVGGNDGIGPRSDFEIFDATKQRWRFGSLDFNRVSAGAAVLADGRLLVAGGGTVGADDAEIVNLDLVDRARKQAKTIDLGEFVVADGAVSIAARAADRVVFVSTAASETGLIAPRAQLETCNSELDCADDEVCVTSSATSSNSRKVCVCAAGNCKRDQFGIASIGGLDEVGVGVRVAVVGDRFAVIAGASRALPLALLDTISDARRAEPVEAMQRTGAAVLTVSDREVLIVGGVDEAGNATAAVELFDVARRVVVLKAPLSRPMGRPLLAPLGNRFVAIDENDDEPIIFSLSGAANGRATLLQPRSGGGVAAGTSNVLIAGGSIEGVPSRLVERLELVDKNADAAGPPLQCITEPIVDGRISGNTRSADDIVRYHQCAVPAYIFGRENLFSFELTENASLRVVNMQQDDNFIGTAHTATLLKGTCDDYVEVACGTGDEEIALFAGNLGPGSYVLAIDYTRLGNQDNDAIFGGTPWSAQALLGPVLTCPIDENDPADDTIAGATYLRPTENDNAQTGGRLCPGDVDHQLFDHWGGDTNNSVGVDGVLATGIEIKRAIVDVAASIAAGHPVASAVTGDPITDMNAAAVGTYVLTLTSAQSSLDFISWYAEVSEACAADVDDSLIPELDNNSAQRASHLAPGQTIERTMCITTDNDLVILDPVVGRASSVDLSAAIEDLRINVFNIVNGELGAARPFTTSGGFTSTRIDLGVLTAPVALRIGAVEAPKDEVRISFNQAQDGDTCQNPVPLVVEGERSGVLTGDATIFNNDVDASLVGDCTNERSPGADVVYVVRLEAGETITLTGDITGDAEDVSLYLLRDCVLDENSCVAGIDDAGGLVAESLTFTNGTVAHDYFVVVDSFYGAPYQWQLDWSITAP